MPKTEVISNEVVINQCGECGDDYLRYADDRLNTKLVNKFCSQKCYNRNYQRSWYHRNKEEQEKRTIHPECAGCGKEFVLRSNAATRRTLYYCSNECYVKAEFSGVEQMTS
jgi:CRISPR/Cas system-associated endonuclease Cas1